MDYHSDFTHVSKSMLSDFIDDRELYRLRYVDRVLSSTRTSSEMEFGSAVHAILLEDVDIETRFQAVPESCLQSNGYINGKALAKHRDDNPDVTFLKQFDLQRLYGCIQSVRLSPLNDVIKSATSREQRYDWTCGFTGLKCKCKPDILVDEGDVIAIHDVKVTARVSPWNWNRTADQFKYWLQDAHYSTGIQKIFKKPVEFTFWLIEDSFPYRVISRIYSDENREIAKKYHQSKLMELASCLDSGDWSNDWSGEIYSQTLKRFDENDEVEFEFVSAPLENLEF